MTLVTTILIFTKPTIVLNVYKLVEECSDYTFLLKIFSQNVFFPYKNQIRGLNRRFHRSGHICFKHNFSHIVFNCFLTLNSRKQFSEQNLASHIPALKAVTCSVQNKQSGWPSLSTACITSSNLSSIVAEWFLFLLQLLLPISKKYSAAKKAKIQKTNLTK